MHKNSPRTLNKLTLASETLRSLTPSELLPVVGGGSDLCLLCPSKTWSGSKKRTILY